MRKKFKVVLALGGGGVRGLAHIGVLKVFEREKIPIDLIVGTSMGAVIGGAYALSKDSFYLERKVLELLKKKPIAKLEALAGESRPEEKRMIVEGLVSFVKDLLLWNLKGIKRSMGNGAEIKEIVRELVEKESFSQTKIPFACIACDLKTGDEVILNKGKLADAVMASSSVAAVFPPVKLGERLLIDGGITSEVPTEAASKLGADFIIVVNVEQKIFYDKFRHGMDILFQSDEIRSHELIRLKMQLADFIVQPQIGDVSWAAFSQGLRCIQEGEKAAEESLDKLKKALLKKKRAHNFKKFFLIKNFLRRDRKTAKIGLK